MVASQLPRIPPRSSQPLGERRQVALAITPIPYREWNKVHNCNCNLVLVFEDDEDGQEPHTPPLPTPSLMEESHLVEIMQGFYIALADDEADVPALRTFDDEPFTHVVQVSYPTPSDSSWRREEAPRNALVQRLTLVCPAVSHYLCDEKTAVGPEELHAARDFLTLALPYGSTTWWPEELRKDGRPGRGKQSGKGGRVRNAQDEQEDDDDVDAHVVFLAPDHGLDDLIDEQCDRVEQDDDVNVLIVAPTSRAVDVLSILFCYLAFLEEDLAETDSDDEVWEDVPLGPWLMVDMIARHDWLDWSRIGQ
ncbi:hypothetical protein J3R83DRAFT_3785 [Lanmaoa asiatica]|nr:hypothetical protein J3R83DRAFT_3785 [Lanmaoa asiatica]